MIEQFQRFYSLASIVWTVFVVAMLIFVSDSLFIKKRIHSDLLSLLPTGHFETIRETQKFIDDTNLSKRVVILVGHQDRFKAKKALNKIRDKIQTSNMPIIEQTTASYETTYRRFLTEIYPSRSGFLSTVDRSRILKDKTTLIARDAFSNITSVFSFMMPNQLETDPFFLFSRYARELAPQTDMQTDADQNMYIMDGKTTWYVMNAILKESGFSLDVQKDVGQKLVTFLDQLGSTDGVSILNTGVIFYALKGFQQANHEISTIGLFSLFTIIGVFLLAFRSVRPLLFALLVIFTGLLSGLSVCLLLFSKIHVVSLLFGSSLIGMTVDYVIHYSNAALNITTFDTPNIPNNRLIVLKTLMPSLLLGALSSALGYAVLGFIPFPGIQEMAVFGAFGLLASFLSVYFWGAFIIKPSIMKVAPPVLTEKTQRISAFKASHMWISSSVLVFFLISLPMISFDDDIRNFQAPDARLKKQEYKIKQLMHIDKSFQFLAVSADSINELSIREEQILTALEPLQKIGDFVIDRAFVHAIPSLLQQRENHVLTQKVYRNEWLAFSKSLNLKNAPQTQEEFKPILLTSKKISLLPDSIKDLIYEKDGQWTGRIMLKKIKNKTALNLALKPFYKVVFVDTQEAYKELFTSYRQKTIIFAGLVFIVIVVILSLLKSIKDAFYITYPVLLAILSTIGFMGVCHVSFTIFHIMGLFIILCIGIDYSLFFYWREPRDPLKFKRGSVLMANSLCAITTLLSFGLLCLSNTKAVHDFGLSIFIGITLCFLMCYIFTK